MKKILWVCNVPIESVAKDCGLKVPSGGGWVQGLYEVIKEDKTIKLSICFPSTDKKALLGEVDGVTYFSFYQKKNLAGMSDPLAIPQRTQKDIIEILNKTDPDILHVFGTEFSHSFLFLRLFNCPERAIVHIQGLASAFYRYYYYADLPSKYLHLFVPSSIFRGTIASQQKEMEKRGVNEIKALHYAGYLLGRTDWDKACTQDLCDAKYHVCNEILRDTFYDSEKVWSYENCEKHMIFASQASYPLKGLHYLLLALPSIINEFPDTKLFVAGTSPIKASNLKGYISRSPYGFYLRKIIKDNNLQNRVVFTGSLSAEEMKDHYLKSNVFVLPSSIENSPNSLGEAMLLGVPCVVSNVGGVSTMFAHNHDGYSYQYNEVHMLSYYIRQMFRNPDAAMKFGEVARDHASITHNRAEIEKRVRDIYDEIIN